MKELKTALIEGVKETLRLVILSIIPILIEGIDVKTGKIEINWHIVLTVAIITTLRAADRFLHIYETENNPELKGQSMGLIRF